MIYKTVSATNRSYPGPPCTYPAKGDGQGDGQGMVTGMVGGMVGGNYLPCPR